MRERTYIFLVVVILIAIFAAWLDFASPHIKFGPVDREITVREGLDLKGGLRVLLEPDVPAGSSIGPDQLATVKTIVEQRVNGLGVNEPQIQTQGTNRLSVELPGIKNPEEAIQIIGTTGLLEFVDAGSTGLTEGDTVQTTGLSAGNSCSGIVGQGATAATPTVMPTATISATAPVTSTPEVAASKVYTTVMTGDCLSDANPGFDQRSRPDINFVLRDKGAKIFGDYTRANTGKYLAIVLDKKVISSPVIQTAITDGRGQIDGNFTIDSAKSLAVQLKYGALPIPLKVVENTIIGATLGEDSVRKSIVAAVIGLGVVVLFMLLNYRLPGLLADLALCVYALVTFAIFKAGIPLWFDAVVLTLPGIAGFILSVGMAVDANILIFERMKEELRAGRPLNMAIEAGFNRAWPSIRDSNISTLITCLILYIFGTNYGASIVAGFALTLAIGVLVSLFTAVTVTRTFLRLTIDLNITQNLWWFGVGEDARRREPLPTTR